MSLARVWSRPEARAKPGRASRTGSPPRSARDRVWVVSELYYPERTSTGFFLTHIAEALAPAFDVRALCSQPTYSARGVIAPHRELRNGVLIRRCRSTRFDKDVLAGRLLNVATFTLSVFFNAVRALRRDDLVLVVTNPPLLPYAMMLAARLRRARLVLLVHDVYPEVLVATGTARSDATLVRVWHRASRRLYRSADRIIVLGRDMRALVAARAGDESRLRVIPNWGDIERIQPCNGEGDRVRARLGLQDSFIVQFMGNMGLSHGMDALVDAAHSLRRQSDVHFVLMGWGARRAWIEQEVARRGLSNVTLLPACTDEELPGYLNACDLAVIPFVPGMGGISVPSRMYNVLAAGKPILALADVNSEIARLVCEERVGWVVPAEMPGQLGQRILEAKAQPGLLAAMGVRARGAAETKYTAGIVQRSYVELFEELFSENQRPGNVGA